MADKVGGLVERRSQELLSHLGLLLCGELFPLLRDERSCLDSSELFEVIIIVGDGDFDEEEEGLRLVIELALEDASGLCDVPMGGWKEKSVSDRQTGGEGRLTV